MASTCTEIKDGCTVVSSSPKTVVDAIQAIITQSYLDPGYSNDYWDLVRVVTIKNDYLEKLYSEKRLEMLKNGDVPEAFLFTCYKGSGFLNTIMHRGLEVRSTKFNFIGDRNKGVVLCKNADIQLRAAQTYYVSYGKIAYVMPSPAGQNNASPTEGADCHCCATLPQTDKILDQAICSQVYIYDRSDGGYSSRPRQCLPVAYVMYQKKVPGVQIQNQVVFHFSCNAEPSKNNSSEIIDLTESDDDENDSSMEASSLSNAAVDVGESSDSKDTSSLVSHFLMLAGRVSARLINEQQQRTSSNNNTRSNFSSTSNQILSTSSSPRLLSCPALPSPPRLSPSPSVLAMPRLSPSRAQDVQPAPPRFSSCVPVLTMPRLSPSPAAQSSHVVSTPRAQAHQSVPRLQSLPVSCVSGAPVLSSSPGCRSQIMPGNNSQPLQQSVASITSIRCRLNSTGTNILIPMQNQSPGGVQLYRITPRPLGTSVPPLGDVPNVGHTSFQGSPIGVRQQLQTITLRPHHSNLSANYLSSVSRVMQNVAEVGRETRQPSNLLLPPSCAAVSEQPAVASAQLLRYTTACAVNRGGEGLRTVSNVGNVAPPVTTSAAFWLLPQQIAAVPNQTCTGGTFSQVPSQRLPTVTYQWPRQNIPIGTPTDAFNVASSRLPSTSLVNFGASREAVFLPPPLTTAAAATPYYVTSNASAVHIGYSVSPQSSAVAGALPVDRVIQSTSNVFVDNDPALASDLALDRTEDASATVGTPPSGARLQTNVKPEQPRSGRRHHGEMIVIDLNERDETSTAGENDLSWMENDDTLSRLLAHLTPRCSDLRRRQSERSDADGDMSALAENDDDDERTMPELSNDEPPSDGQNEVRPATDGANASFDISVPQNQCADSVQQSQETVSSFDGEYSLSQLLDDIVSHDTSTGLLQPIQTDHKDRSGPSENDISTSHTSADQLPYDAVVAVTNSAVNQSDSSVLNQSFPAIVDVVGRQLDGPLVCTSDAVQMDDLETNAVSRTESVLLTEIEHINPNSLQTDSAHHEMPVSSPSAFCLSAATSATVAVSSSVSVRMSSSAASDVSLLPVTGNAADNTAPETVSSCSVWPVQSLCGTATAVVGQNPQTFVASAMVETSSGTDGITTPFVVLSVPESPNNKSSKRHNVGSSTTAPSPATVTSIATQLVSGLRSSNVIRQRAIIANNLVGTQRRFTNDDSSNSSKVISDGLQAKFIAAATPTQQQNTSSALSGSSANIPSAPASSSLIRKPVHDQLNFGKTTENTLKRRGENLLDEPRAKMLRQQKPSCRDVSCLTPDRSTVMCETVVYRLEPDGTVLTKVETQPAMSRYGSRKPVKLQAVLELDCGVPEAWYDSRLLETLTKKFGILKVINAAKKSSRLYQLNAGQVISIELPSETCMNEQIAATDADCTSVDKRRRRFNQTQSDQRLAPEDVTADSRCDFMHLSDKESSDSQRTNIRDESTDTNLVIEDTHSISEECFSNFVNVAEASIGNRNSQVVKQTAVAAAAADTGNSNSNQIPENAGFGGICNVLTQTSVVEHDPSAHRSNLTVAKCNYVNTAEDKTLPETQEHLSTQVMGNCAVLPSTVNSASILEPNSPSSIHQSDHTKDAANILESDAASASLPTSQQTHCAVDCSTGVLRSDAVSETDVQTPKGNAQTGNGAIHTFASNEETQLTNISSSANQGAVSNKQTRSSNPYVEKGALLLPREISFQRRSVLFGRETGKKTSMVETPTQSKPLDDSNLVKNNSAIALTAVLTETETEQLSAISEVGEHEPVSRSNPEPAVEEYSSLDLHCSDLDDSLRSDIQENSSVCCKSNSDDVLPSQAAASMSGTIERENEHDVASGVESDLDASRSRNFPSSSGTEAGGMEIEASNRSCDTESVTPSVNELDTGSDTEPGCTQGVHSELQSVSSSSVDVECNVTDETVTLSGEFERKTTTSEESSPSTNTVTTLDSVSVIKNSLDERRESSERFGNVIEQATVGDICDGALVCEMETAEPMISKNVDLVSVPEAMPVSTNACEKSSQLDCTVSDGCLLPVDSPSNASAGNQPDSDVEPASSFSCAERQQLGVNETALPVSSCGSSVLLESSSSLVLALPDTSCSQLNSDIQPISPDWMLCTEPEYPSDQTNAEINHHSVTGMMNKMPKRLSLADYKNRKMQNDANVSATGHSTSASLRGVSSTIAQRFGRCLSGPAGVNLSKSTFNASVTADFYGQRTRAGSTGDFMLDCTECESIAHEGTGNNVSSAHSVVSRNKQAEVTACTISKTADRASCSVADPRSTMCALESTCSDTDASVVGVGQLSRGNDQNIGSAVSSGVKLVLADHSCINSQSKLSSHVTQVVGSAANECTPAVCSSPQYEGVGASKKKQKRNKYQQFEDDGPWDRVLSKCEPSLPKRSNYGDTPFSETSCERYLLDPRPLDEEGRRRYHDFITETVLKVDRPLIIPCDIDRGLIKHVTVPGGEKNVTDKNGPLSAITEPTVRNLAMAKATDVSENSVTNLAEDGSEACSENTPPVPVFDERQTKILEELVSHPNPEQFIRRNVVLRARNQSHESYSSTKTTTSTTNTAGQMEGTLTGNSCDVDDADLEPTVTNADELCSFGDSDAVFETIATDSKEPASDTRDELSIDNFDTVGSFAVTDHCVEEHSTKIRNQIVSLKPVEGVTEDVAKKQRLKRFGQRPPVNTQRSVSVLSASDRGVMSAIDNAGFQLKSSTLSDRCVIGSSCSEMYFLEGGSSSAEIYEGSSYVNEMEQEPFDYATAAAAAADENELRNSRQVFTSEYSAIETTDGQRCSNPELVSTERDELFRRKRNDFGRDVVETPFNSNKKQGHKLGANAWQRTLETWPEISKNIDHCSRSSTEFTFYSLYPITSIMKKFVDLSEVDRLLLEGECRQSLESVRCLAKEESVYTDFIEELGWPVIKKMANHLPALAKELVLLDRINEITDKLSQMSEKVYNLSGDQAEIRCYKHGDLTVKHDVVYSLLLLASHVHYDELRQMSKYHRSKLVYTVPDNLRLEAEINRFTSVENCNMFIRNRSIEIDDCMELFCLKLEIEAVQAKVRNAAAATFSGHSVIERLLCRLGWLHHHRRNKLLEITCNSCESLSSFTYIVSLRTDWYRMMSAYIEKSNLSNKPDLISFIDIQLVILVDFLNVIPHLHLTAAGNWIMTESNEQSS